MTYEELVQQVRNYWADSSREPSETREDLLALSYEIDLLIDSLP